MRKKMILVMLALCLLALPPFISFYNRGGLFLGLPVFLVGLLAISLGMVLVTFLLYRHEEMGKKGRGKK